MARSKAPAPGTRTRILAAACDEFGAHGFAATSVDRIARRARVNKAMIYYHFPNKRALYTWIIRDIFAPITERVRAAMQEHRPRYPFSASWTICTLYGALPLPSASAKSLLP